MYISRNLEQWNAFLQMLKIAFEENKAQEFLTLLLTADERDAVGLRLQIVSQLLDKNLPQREIQQNLNTSAATITRGSNMIKTMDPDFMQWMKQHLDLIEKKLSEFLPHFHAYLVLNGGKKTGSELSFVFFRRFCFVAAFSLCTYPIFRLYGTTKSR
ncbi:Trp operon repressor [Haemophilus aegyptius ATCC 11116]|nr:Trp operon repressor [Haemophilus aegyptius ATCC 11116]